MKRESKRPCMACMSGGAPECFEPGPPMINRCRACGFMWTVPEHTADEQKEFFENDYIGDEQRAEEDFGDLRRATLAREASAIGRLRPEGGRLLDVGCASGEFLVHMRGHPGWCVEGLEPSLFAARHARERHGLQVTQGTLATARWPDRTFDVIAVLDVIGLWRDPEAEFGAITRLLAPRGLLALEIPCLRFRLLKNSGLVSRAIYGRRTQLNQRIHLHFWSRRTLGTQLARHGFREVFAQPEQSPVYGSAPLRFLNRLYYTTTAAAYRASGGAIPLVPKEFLVYELRS